MNDQAIRESIQAVESATVIDKFPIVNDPAKLSVVSRSKKKDLRSSINNDVTDVTDVTAFHSAVLSVTSDVTSDVTDVTPTDLLTVTAADRPCFKVFDKWAITAHGKLKPGVYQFNIKSSKGDNPPSLTHHWICSPLYVEAVTFDGQENNFGRLLHFITTLGRKRTWAMPMELLCGSGENLRRVLLSMGVNIDPNAFRLLGQYLQDEIPKRLIHCALQVGWYKDSFVLPDTVIGDGAENVIFQSGETDHEEYAQAGSIAGWKTDIAARAVGNPLLVLAVSASFTGPLLGKCNAEGGGIHFVGDTSTGKTTLINTACATWGSDHYRRSWRATANGMEGAAALFNDGLLALDEISECEPKDVGAIVYTLGNGRGKQRADRSGSARSIAHWRCMVLSSGERTISTVMAEGGFKAKAGQGVRLLDVPATRTYGAWDELHGCSTGAVFSDTLKRAAVTHYGHVGRAFLEKLTRDKRDFTAYLERVKAQIPCDSSEGRDKRAAARFALIALAGELATEYGLTGWPEGMATEAAIAGFKSWQAFCGKGNDENRQILNQLASFIERHGDSRFSNANSQHDIRNNRAGYWRDDGPDGRVYLFNKDGLHEALHGFDFNRALDVLEGTGALQKGKGSERAKSIRIDGRVMKLYFILSSNLRSDHGD
jgi:putative DNA primase/helicase